MRSRRNRTRNERRMEIWGAVRAALTGAAVALVALLLLGAEEPPEGPDVQEYRARFEAQERYYQVVDRDGDVEGAVEAAKLVWEEQR